MSQLPYYGQGPHSWRVRAMQQIQKQNKPPVQELPQGFPTLQEQAAYWERKELERTGGENDWLDDESQFSNHENHEL